MQTTDFFSRMVRINELGPNMPSSAGGNAMSVWFCSSCKKDYETQRGADECCGSFNSSIEYFCVECNKQHASESGAKECCARATVPAVCPVCMSRAESHEDAIECCLHTHPALTKAGMDQILAGVKSGKSWSEAFFAIVGN